MAEFKRQTFLLSTGKQVKLHGNSFFISKSLEIGEGFVPNIFSLFEEQAQGKTSASVSNPHKFTSEELQELADYNIRLWLDLKDSIRNNGLNNPRIFGRDLARSEDVTEEKTPKSKRDKVNFSKEPEKRNV